MSKISKEQYENIIAQVNLELKKIMREERDMKILKEYQMYDFFYNQQLNEGLSTQSKEDLRELQHVLGNLGKVCARLMYRLIKWGAKKSVQLCVKAAKAAYKSGKANPEICKNFLYALLFFCVGYGGNTIKEWYNNKPIIEGTQIEQRTINGVDSLVVHEVNSDTVTIVQQPNKEEAPVVKTGKKKSSNQDAVKVEDDSPIRLLQPGETKKTRFEPSDELIQGMLEVEHFVDHIYDAKHPDKPVNIKELRRGQCNGKYDWTMMYGHHLTEQECKTLDPKKKYTKEEGFKVFKKDLTSQVNICNNKLKQLPYYDKVQFSDNFFYGFVDLVFNCGAGQTFGNATRKESEFWRRMNNIRTGNNGKYIKQDVDYSLASINTLLCGRKDQKGLKFRRRQEYLLMISSDNYTNPERFHFIEAKYRK